ncbi:MAG: hypothetical protein ABH870_09125 [bacterium]
MDMGKAESVLILKKLRLVQSGFNPQITQISQITDEMGKKNLKGM